MLIVHMYCSPEEKRRGVFPMAGWVSWHAWTADGYPDRSRARFSHAPVAPG